MLRCVLLDGAARVPSRNHPTDAGYDLYALEDVWVKARQSSLVSTGVAVAIPKGYYGRIASRSGLALGCDLEVGAGVVDASYRGELKVLLRNHGDRMVCLRAGDRIAQMIVTPIYVGEIEKVETLDDTERGAKGFGSSGR